MKAHLKIFADPGERSDIVRVSFGIVRGMERVSGVNCVYFPEHRWKTSALNEAWEPPLMAAPGEFSTATFFIERERVCGRKYTQLTPRPFSLPLLIITQTKTQYPLDRIISLSYNQTRLGKPMNCIGKERQ